jgi:hypothetical protein
VRLIGHIITLLMIIRDRSVLLCSLNGRGRVHGMNGAISSPAYIAAKIVLAKVTDILMALLDCWHQCNQTS